MKRRIIFLLFFYCVFPQYGISQDGDFNKLKAVLEKDGLLEVIEKSEQEKAKKAEIALIHEKTLFNVPDRSEFIGLMSKLWLVRNAAVLRWDFTPTDFGLDLYLQKFLQERGMFGVRFKILLVDSTQIYHFSLPLENGEVLLMMSLPFMRILDLSKVEISLLFLEDILRWQKEQFVSKLTLTKFEAHFGKSFYGQTLDPKDLEALLSQMGQVVLERGYSFDENYKITMGMDSLLKSQLPLWNQYYKLTEKIKNLVEKNILYKNYNKIYPSADVKMGWLTAGKK